MCIRDRGYRGYCLPGCAENQSPLDKLLQVNLQKREERICVKLYAKVEVGQRSKRLTDLLTLSATYVELIVAARWTGTDDPSVWFLGVLRGDLAHLGVEVSNVDL